MAAPLTQTTSSTGSAGSAGNTRTGIIVLCALFFFMGLITVLNDILVPKLKALFQLNYAQSQLVQFCFFTAYFVMSIPSSGIIRRLGYKRALVTSLIVIAGSLLLFLPAAGSGQYWIFLAALFLVASGITLLQVASNPYVTSLGAPEKASFRLVLVQAFNSVATTVGPPLGAAIILGSAGSGGAAENDPSSIQSLYAGIAIAVGIAALVLALIKLPQVQSESASGSGTFAPLQFRHLRFGVIGIFCYVGAEVAIGSFMVNYLLQPSLRDTSLMDSLWHIFGHDTPLNSATSAQIEEFAGRLLALYWGGAMVGRLLGSALLNRMAPQNLLRFNATAAAVLVLIALLAPGTGISAVALLLVGLCNSVMFPVIFSLAVADLKQHTTNASGLLCTAIVGGALVPLMQGLLADAAGLGISYILPLACYAYILFFALRGYRVVNRPA